MFTSKPHVCEILKVNFNDKILISNGKNEMIFGDFCVHL